MKFQADSKTKDMEFEEGDSVYVQLQPYRQSCFAKSSENLSHRIYGPFPTGKKINAVLLISLHCLGIPKHILYTYLTS